MKLRDICEKLKSGEIEIDTCGHTTNDLKPWFIERYEHMVENENGAADGKWTLWDGKTMEEVNATMRESYTRMLDMEYDSSIRDPELEAQCIISWEETCFCCGETLHYSFDGTKLNLNVRYDPNKLKGFGFGRYHYCNCDWKDKELYTVEIDVTGNLVFANWFPDFDKDCEDEDRHTRDFSLNSTRGRYNIAQWKAKNQNIAYSQVGSCGKTSIWMNEERNHGYICEGWIGDGIWNEETKQYEEVEALKSYAQVGQTDVEVWRVEMGDSKKVDMIAINKKWKTKGEYARAASVKVKKGKWQLTSYYATKHPFGSQILAEIELVKN